MCILNFIESIPSNWVTVQNLESFSIIIGAGVAVWGIKAWRHELIERKKIDLAEELLTGFYEFQDLMLWVRSPFNSGEGTTRKGSKNESNSEKRIKDTYFAPIEKLNEQRAFLGKLKALKYRSKAYFGEDAVKPFILLNDVRSSVTSSAQMLIICYGDGTNKETLKKWKADIGWVKKDDDKIIKKINEAVNQIELICKPYLSKK